ncbi:MAG TPA: septal ring lytic transglycosylase RlpA family protein [Polyangiaceae bacterium]
MATRPPPADETGLEARYGTRRALAVLTGEASYYGDSLAGHRTADGERYDPAAFTAANRTLPFGTVVRVVRTDSSARGRGPVARYTVYVRITDRGPFGRARRILDLSRAAAERLHMIRAGVAPVRAEVLEYGPRPRRRR